MAKDINPRDIKEGVREGVKTLDTVINNLSDTIKELNTKIENLGSKGTGFTPLSFFGNANVKQFKTFGGFGNMLSQVGDKIGGSFGKLLGVTGRLIGKFGLWGTVMAVGYGVIKKVFDRASKNVSEMANIYKQNLPAIQRGIRVMTDQRTYTNSVLFQWGKAMGFSANEVTKFQYELSRTGAATKNLGRESMVLARAGVSMGNRGLFEGRRYFMSLERQQQLLSLIASSGIRTATETDKGFNKMLATSIAIAKTTGQRNQEQTDRVVKILTDQVTRLQEHTGYFSNLELTQKGMTEYLSQLRGELSPEQLKSVLSTAPALARGLAGTTAGRYFLYSQLGGRNIAERMFRLQRFVENPFENPNVLNAILKATVRGKSPELAKLTIMEILKGAGVEAPAHLAERLYTMAIEKIRKGRTITPKDIEAIQREIDKLKSTTDKMPTSTDKLFKGMEEKWVQLMDALKKAQTDAWKESNEQIAKWRMDRINTTLANVENKVATIWGNLADGIAEMLGLKNPPSGGTR